MGPGKTQKTYFFIQSSFVHFLVTRLIFGYHQRGAVVAAFNLIQVMQFVFDDVQHLLISMARSFKYFHNIELVRYSLLLFCLKKDQFWFLLMLRTFTAEVQQKKISREIQIAQPPRQLQGCLRFQMKDVCHIYNLLERLEWEF